MQNIIGIALLLVTTWACNAQVVTLKLINYNALHGFNADSTLQRRYINWVRQLNPDIVAYQEMNGYTQNALGLLAESYGHPYAVIMNEEYGVPVTHPLAITSKYPILNVERVMDNMWHGYLYGYINGIHLFVTHLAPFTLKDRQKDVDQILAQAALLDEDAKIIIAGDFNALSPVDSARYGKRLLNSMKRIEGRLEPKSGTPIVRGRTIYRNNLNDGKVDYSVIQRMLDGGYKDSYYLVNSEFKNTVPTREHAGTDAILRRIDYVWVNKLLANDVRSVQIIQDEITAGLSDHYPVAVELNVSTKHKKGNR